MPPGPANGSCASICSLNSADLLGSNEFASQHCWVAVGYRRSSGAVVEGWRATGSREGKLGGAESVLVHHDPSRPAWALRHGDRQSVCCSGLRPVRLGWRQPRVPRPHPQPAGARRAVVLLHRRRRSPIPSGPRSSPAWTGCPPSTPTGNCATGRRSPRSPTRSTCPLPRRQPDDRASVTAASRRAAEPLRHHRRSGHQVFVTDTLRGHCSTQLLELRHRGHARVGDRIRTGKTAEAACGCGVRRC